MNSEYNILIQGFLEKVAVSPEYIMKRLANVHKQIRNMGVVTRRGGPPVTNALTTVKGEALTIVRGGSKKTVLPAQIKNLNLTPFERHMVTDKIKRIHRLATPARSISPERQKLQNLLTLHHEKTEAQAVKRFNPLIIKETRKSLSNPNMSFWGHAHPSVIEREARILKRLRGKHKDIHRAVIDARKGEAMTMPDYTGIADPIRQSFLNRYDKAYDYYRNL